MQPPWERRLQHQIEILRKNIGRLTQALKDNCSVKIQREAEKIMFRYKNEENQTIITVLDQLKQILAVKSNRLRRYHESNLRKKQNKLFQTNEKQFYRSIQMNNAQGPNRGEVPNAQDVNKYGRDIWTQSKHHNLNAGWIQTVKDEYEDVPMMNDHCIHIEDVKER